MTAADPRAAIAEITQAVTAAQRALAEGTLVDLKGLDRAVAHACAAAQAAPAADRPALVADLAALTQGLDRLTADLVRQGEAVRRCRAASAYGAGEET